MQKCKVGVIGVGYLGRFHAQKYAAAEGAELVGVADLDAGQGARVATECGCAFYTSYQELLPLVDAVSVVVPTTIHFPVAKECLLAGKDVLLEKPMTVTLAEADQLVQIAAEKKLLLQIGHLERFNPAVQAMQPFLTQPLFIESSRIAPFKSRGADVDVVLDLMIHDIDIILTIVQSPLSQIHTVGAPVVTPTTDIANARLIFANGATANVTASRISRSTVRQMRIFQPGSYINVDFAERHITTIELTGEILANGMPGQNIKEMAFAAGDALQSEIAHFLDCINSRQQPIVSGREGRYALDVALQVMAQIREHQQQPVFRSYLERH